MALQDSWDLQSRATDVDFPEDLLVPKPLAEFDDLPIEKWWFTYEKWWTMVVYLLKMVVYVWKMAKNGDLPMKNDDLPIKKGWFTYE